MNIIELFIKHFDKIAGAILVGSFGGYVAYRTYMKKNQIEKGRDLITTFDKTKKAINNYEGQFYLLESLLYREFEGQRKAAREFRRHLGIINRYRFNKAWNKYYDGNEDNPYFRQYIITNDIQDLLLSRINEILKFAK